MSKAQNKIKNEWSPDFAYIIGLITTDGSLSKDGRHIIFTSKDKELVTTFKRILNLSNTIGLKSSGANKTKIYNYIQFGDINFYEFLRQIGLMPNKTLNLKSLKIPQVYFFDFLRGHFDGDGSFYSYWDKRWKSSFMFYTTFASASKQHILWLRNYIKKLLKLKGHITHAQGSTVYQLKYAKKESRILLNKMYYSDKLPCLLRKRLKIFSLFDKINKNLPRGCWNR
ncbi:MAG: LAGLIDADG family homing endonuclease [Candidatus Parcubacteria bacterium]|nr:LAGLIDADG family homing endonuclease [Candidatus Parcubacteria bacterium]